MINKITFMSIGILYVLCSFNMRVSSAEAIDAPGEQPMPDIVYEDRYLFSYSPIFFQPGGNKVRFIPALHLRIGVVINNKSDLALKEIIHTIMSVSPFDRYRDFFVFLLHDEVQRNIHLRNHFISAYDSDGTKIPGGFDIANTSVRTGMIVLNIDDYEFEKTMTRGYTVGSTAVVQKASILHEFGHALSHLGEEYSTRDTQHKKETDKLLTMIGVNSSYRDHVSWFEERANLDYRSHSVLKWQPLIEQGCLPEKRYHRVQMKEGIDIGRFLIPSDRCCMGNLEYAEYCPVCQLEIIDSICKLTGATPPWYSSDRNSHVAEQ